MTRLVSVVSSGGTKLKGQAAAVRFSRFLFVFDLRQGAILIAVQNIAISSCTLVMLLVGIAHALETMNVLNADMEDNAEREGAIIMDEDDLTLLRDGPTEVTNNQKKFRVAYHLAIMMVFFLYSSLVGTTIYLIFCISLFYGAAKKKKEYVLPWIMYASFSMLLLVGALFVGDKSQTLTEICGGHNIYRFSSLLLVMGHVYCIVTVASYTYELKQLDAKRREMENLQTNVDVSDKRMLLARESIKIPYDEYNITGVAPRANQV